MGKIKYIILLALLTLLFSACSTPQKKIILKKSPPKKEYTIINKQFHLNVTATAYTSHGDQTDDTPYLAAWNNKLNPKVKSIAVSRDLLDRGLINGVKVRIKGLHGTYVVLDKMNKRWKKKIDIYMGKDIKRARRWGKKRVVIYWHKKSIELLKKKKKQYYVYAKR